MNIFEKITYANYALDAVNTAVAIGSTIIYEDTRTSHDLNPLGLNVDTLFDTVPWTLLAVDAIAMIALFSMTCRKRRPEDSERDVNLRSAVTTDNSGSTIYRLGCFYMTYHPLKRAAVEKGVEWGVTGSIYAIGVAGKIAGRIFANKMSKPETVAEAIEAAERGEMPLDEALLAVSNQG